MSLLISSFRTTRFILMQSSPGRAGMPSFMNTPLIHDSSMLSTAWGAQSNHGICLPVGRDTRRMKSPDAEAVRLQHECHESVARHHRYTTGCRTGTPMAAFPVHQTHRFTTGCPNFSSLTRECQCSFGVIGPVDALKSASYWAALSVPSMSTYLSRLTRATDPSHRIMCTNVVPAKKAFAKTGAAEAPLPHGVWPGLESWRQGGVRHDLVWGKEGPVSYRKEEGYRAEGDQSMLTKPAFHGAPWDEAVSKWIEEERIKDWTLVSIGKAVFGTPDVAQKLALTHLAHSLWEEGAMGVGELEGEVPDVPLLPERPQLVICYNKAASLFPSTGLALPSYLLAWQASRSELYTVPSPNPAPLPAVLLLTREKLPFSLGPFLQVPPRQVPKPGKHSPLPLSPHLLHTLAHVEMNAVHLAWDTAIRFAPLLPKLGRDFFSDFLRVAADEARHFAWCQQRLGELGSSYGDMPAHNLLWVDCRKSAERVQDRLAVIPMVQEARGLDAGPRLIERLVGAGDNRTAGIVQKICEEEMAHVAVGVAWFSIVCEEMGQDSYGSFRSIIRNLSADGVKGPFNHEARKQAGLPRHWYDFSDEERGNMPEGAASLKQVQSRLAVMLAEESIVQGTR